jgi:hypothetical protein
MKSLILKLVLVLILGTSINSLSNAEEDKNRLNNYSSKVKLEFKDNKPGIEPNTRNALKYTIILNRNKVISDVKVSSFQVVVTYCLDFLGLAFIDSERTKPKIELSSQLAELGYKMLPIEKKVDKELNIEIILMRFEGLKPLFDTEGDINLVTLTFDSFLPYYKDKDGDLVMKSRATTIRHEIITDDEYYEIKGGSALVRIDSTCVDSINDSQPIHKPTYYLMEIKPNTIDSNGANIIFGVGGKNVKTEIMIYNSSGQLISTVFSKSLNKGEYSVRIPIEDMPNGIYFYEMTAGPYKSETMKLVVRK